MSQKINITEARKKFLLLPEEIGPDEILEVVRHGNVVLKITRPRDESTHPDPFLILDKALESLPQRTRKSVPKDLAVHYKKYLYDKKRS